MILSFSLKKDDSVNVMLIMSFLGIFFSFLCLLFMLDIKSNYHTNSYHNHLIYATFPIKRYILIIRELFYFDFRIDIIVLKISFLLLCYNIFFYKESIYELIQFIALFQLQSIFVLTLLLTVKVFVKKNEEINSYLYPIFFIIIMLSSTYNALLSKQNLFTFMLFSPIHSLFHMSIIDSKNFLFSSYFIIGFCGGTMILLINKKSREWPL